MQHELELTSMCSVQGEWHQRKHLKQAMCAAVYDTKTALLHEVPRLEAVHAQAIGFDGGDHPVMGKCLELVA